MVMILTLYIILRDYQEYNHHWKPTETFRVNTIGTQVVCEGQDLNNVKMIYAGSSSRWHNPYQSPYACFKHMGEEVIRMYKQTYGLKRRNCKIL